MADFNEDEIDKGFRRVIEGKSVEPPASLWANIRISALERQLIRYQSMTFWFKGAVGVLAALLGGTGYFLYQAKSALPLVQKEVVTITKTDTVYLTKSEKVFVDRPVVVYAENLNAKMNEINPDFNKNEQNDETGTSDNTLTKDGKRDLNNEPITQNGLTANPSSKQNSQKTIKNSKLITNRVKNSNARYSEQNNSTKNQVDKIKNNAFFPQETPISSQESIKDGKLTEGSPIEDLTIDFLEPLPM
ncbi:MAG TPA: hypothetical protein DCM71_20245 [Runella sp.]|nr:hypothetical protein [Runella sp.]